MEAQEAAARETSHRPGAADQRLAIKLAFDSLRESDSRLSGSALDSIGPRLDDERPIARACYPPAGILLNAFQLSGESDANRSRRRGLPLAVRQSRQSSQTCGSPQTGA